MSANLFTRMDGSTVVASLEQAEGPSGNTYGKNLDDGKEKPESYLLQIMAIVSQGYICTQ
jgi:hypothetical protein